jgi:hypothetical protein
MDGGPLHIEVSGRLLERIRLKNAAAGASAYDQSTPISGGRVHAPPGGAPVRAKRQET